jgi:hypothetical protein
VTRRAQILLVGLLTVWCGLLVPGVASAAPSSAQTPAPTRAQDGPTSPIILIGTGGLAWSDVSARNTPALWSFLRDGSTAALTVRSVFTNTCPVDGWLGLSAGDRAAAPGPQPGGERTPADPCPAIPAVDSGFVPGWDTYIRAAAATKFGSHLGTLGEQLASNGQCVQAVGPGAGLAAAYTSGAVPRYAAFDPSQLTGLLSRCRVTLVDVGSLRDPHDVASGERPPPSGSRSDQVKAIDARIAEVLTAAPGGSDLVVGSLSDAGRSERLRLVAAKGPDYPSGTLFSPSTRQTGLVQSPDLTVTLLTAGTVPIPTALGGTPLERGPVDGNSAAAAEGRLRQLVDFDQASHKVHDLVPPFFDAVVYSQLAIYLLAALVWRTKRGSAAQRRRMLRVVRRVAVVAATVPASTFLANLFPWWRSSSPMLTIVLSVGVFVPALSAVALLGPWARHLTGPIGAVALLTMLVLGGDVILGSHLQVSSLMGLQPVVGGRYYGMGNVTFALFATAALLLATAVSGHYVRQGRPRVAAGAALAIGLVAAVVDGAPSWGADGGGPPSLLPGLAYLVLVILGIRMTWRRGLLIGGTTVGLFLLVGFLDWLRPPDSRSHLGRFIQSMIDGGAFDIVSRKLDQNISILFSTPLALLVPVGLALAIVVLARPSSRGSRALRRSFEACPTLRPGLIALLVMLTIGFAINDSGVAIPANGALIAVPLVIAISVRVLEDEVRTTAFTRAQRRG